MSSTGQAYDATRVCYAMAGSEMVWGAVRLLGQQHPMCWRAGRLCYQPTRYAMPRACKACSAVSAKLIMLPAYARPM